MEVLHFGAPSNSQDRAGDVFLSRVTFAQQRIIRLGFKVIKDRAAVFLTNVERSPWTISKEILGLVRRVAHRLGWSF